MADAVAVGYLGLVLWWLAGNDGGFSRSTTLPFAVATLVAVPVAAAQAARLPALGRWLVGAWGSGALLALVFAAERSGFIHESVTWAAIPVVALAAWRVVARRWGPGLLVVLLLATFGRYWYWSFLTWWGDALWGRAPLLRPLSWHNQSGMLMGSFGLLFLGFAVRGRRLLGVAGALLGGAGLAGAWLSGSRGAVIATGLGLLVVVIAASTDRRHRRTLVGLAATFTVAGIVVVALLRMVAPEAGGGQPITNREQTASTNLQARLRHMEAAVGMFGDRPLTGHGPGSYRTQALAYTAADANLTSSAHNEFLEALGEGGIVFGGAFWLAHLLALSLLLRARRAWLGAPVADFGSAADLRHLLGLGSAGVVVGLGVHTAVDFDWGYPALPSLLAVAVAVLGAAVVVPSSSPRRLGHLVLAPFAIVLVLAGAGRVAELRANVDQSGLTAEAYARSAVPWDHVSARDRAARLASGGDTDLALATLDRTIKWNPGVRGLAVVRDTVAFRDGRFTAEELLASVDQGYVRFEVRNYVASALIDEGDFDEAEQVLESLVGEYADHVRWGVTETSARTWTLVVELEAARSGCDAARSAVERAVREGGVTPDRADAALAAVLTEVCG
ncbi:MAG: O-antigen ligase family protein [Nitriliruptorales bacterium]